MTRIAMYSLSILLLLLTSCKSDRQLTRDKAKDILDKLAAQSSITKITISSDQGHKVKNLGASENIDLRAVRACLPDPNDVRVTFGQFALCQGGIPPEVTWQRPGFLISLKEPVKWTIVEVTGIADAPNSTNEKVVEYTWRYDFSHFPREAQEALTQPPSAGKSRLRLYDDGWRFVDFQ